MRLLEHREEKQFSSHTARKGQSQNLNPKGLAPEPYSKCWPPRQEWRETGGKLTQRPGERWWDRKSESHSLTKPSRVEFDPSSNITRVCWKLGHKREIKLGFYLLFIPSKDRSSADPFMLLSTAVTGTVLCLVTQSCPTLCDPTDCSLPGTSVHGDSPGILEWVAMPTSRGSSQPRDQTQISHIPGGFFTVWATTPDLHNLDGPDKFKLWVQYDKVKHSFSIDRHTIYNLTFLRVLTYLGNFCSFCQYYYSQLKTNYGHYKIPVPLTFPKLYHFSSKMVTPLPLNLGGFDCNQ